MEEKEVEKKEVEKQATAQAMERRPKRLDVAGIALLLCALLLLIGSKTFLRACGIHEDGSYASCHWAEQAVTGIACALTLQAILHLLLRTRAQKAAVALAMLPTALAAALLPGFGIPLCMMKTMRCHAVMRPGVLLLSALLIAVAVVEAVRGLRKGERADDTQDAE